MDESLVSPLKSLMVFCKWAREVRATQLGVAQGGAGGHHSGDTILASSGPDRQTTGSAIQQGPKPASYPLCFSKCRDKPLNTTVPTCTGEMRKNPESATCSCCELEGLAGKEAELPARI